MNTFNMTCEAVEATLPDYMDETLEAWVRSSVEEHLGQCLRCAALVRDLRNIEREAAVLPDLIPVRDLWPGIESRIGTPAAAFVPTVVSEREPPAAFVTGVASETEPAAVVSESASAPAISESERALVVGESEPIASDSEPADVVSETVTASDSNDTVIPIKSRQTVIPIESRQTVIPIDSHRKRRRFFPVWIGAAAAALVVLTAGTTYLLTSRVVRPAPAENAVTALPSLPVLVASEPGGPPPGAERGSDNGNASTESGSAETSATEPSRATPPASRPRAALARRSPTEAVYDKEILMLQSIMRWRKAELDPATAAIIDRNLRIIDAAIAQSRAALRRDPASAMISEQLTHALDKKVELLRTAAMLPSST